MLFDSSNFLVKIVLFLISLFETDDRDPMHVTLNDGNKMPTVGYGTWLATGADLEKALNVALQVGYRHIDTAPPYDNEHIIGKVLQEWFSAGKLKREDVYICTKLPINAMRPELVGKYLKKSLENLKLDYVDMYLIHVPFAILEEEKLFPRKEKYQLDNNTDHVAIWKAMEEQVDAGRTKSIGLSNFNETQVQRILDNARIPPANLQIELHINMQEKSLVEFCEDNEIVVTSFASLGTAGARKIFGIEIPSILENSVVLELAKKYDTTPAQILLRFHFQNGIVVIPKSVQPNRVYKNFHIFDFELDDEEMEKLELLDRGEEGRILVVQYMFPDFANHPEYPFPLRPLPSET